MLVTLKGEILAEEDCTDFICKTLQYVIQIKINKMSKKITETIFSFIDLMENNCLSLKESTTEYHFVLDV